MGLKLLIKALGLPDGSTVDDVIRALAIADGATVGDVLAAIMAALDSLPADPVPAGGPPAPAPVPASAVNEEAMAARIAASVLARIEVEQADNLTPLEKSLLTRATPAERRAFIATKVKANVLPGASNSGNNGAADDADSAVARATGLPLTYVKGGK